MILEISPRAFSEKSFGAVCVYFIEPGRSQRAASGETDVDFLNRRSSS